MNSSRPTPDDLLASATRLHAVGPRPAQDRPLIKTLQKVFQTGVLGTMMALQLVSGIAPAAAQSFESPPAAVQIQEAKQAFNGIELVIPFKDIAAAQHLIKDNGTLDAFSLVQSWRDHDVEPISIINMVELLNLTQSPVFVRSQQDKDNVLAVANRTAEIFEIQSNDQAVEFLNNHNLSRLELDGVFVEGTALTNTRAYGDFDFDHLMNVWSHSSQLYHGSESAPLEADLRDQSMPAAIEHVRSAMQESGLNSVRVLLPMWTSGKHIQSVGETLQNANQELQNITGWDGQVLGLKGQVDYTVGVPYYGASTQLGKDGKIQIQSQFSEMAHEWLHALEASVVMARNPNVSFDNITRMSHGHDHGGSWAQLTKEIKNISRNHARSFEKRMDDLAQSNRNAGETNYMKTSYYESNLERLAYQFGSFVTAKLSHGDHVLDHASNVTDRSADAPRPSMKEGLSTAPAWNKVFTSLKSEYWNSSSTQVVVDQVPATIEHATVEQDPSSVAPSTLSASSLQSWRSKRQADPTHEPSRPSFK